MLLVDPEDGERNQTNAQPGAQAGRAASGPSLSSTLRLSNNPDFANDEEFLYNEFSELQIQKV